MKEEEKITLEFNSKLITSCNENEILSVSITFYANLTHRYAFYALNLTS